MHTVLHSQSVHKFAGEKHFTMLTIANMIRIDSLLRSALPLLTTDSTPQQENGVHTLKWKRCPSTSATVGNCSHTTRSYRSSVAYSWSPTRTYAHKHPLPPLHMHTNTYPPHTCIHRHTHTHTVVENSLVPRATQKLVAKMAMTRLLNSVLIVSQHSTQNRLSSANSEPEQRSRSHRKGEFPGVKWVDLASTAGSLWHAEIN